MFTILPSVLFAGGARVLYILLLLSVLFDALFFRLLIGHCLLIFINMVACSSFKCYSIWVWWLW